jgi:hypothetical protein
MIANRHRRKGGRLEKVEISTALQYRGTIASMTQGTRQDKSHHACASCCISFAVGVMARGIRNTNPKNVSGAIGRAEQRQAARKHATGEGADGGMCRGRFTGFRQTVFHAPACRK